MGDLWVLLFLPLFLEAIHGAKGCLECDPKFIEDVRTVLGNLVPVEVPGRTQLLDRQHKEITQLSSKVSHKDKTLRLLAVRNVVKLRVWLKEEIYKLGNETWKGVFITQGKFLIIRQHLESQLREMLKNFSAVGNKKFLPNNIETCSEDCIVIEGPVLDCWTCLRMTTRCFRGDYCKDENPKKAENREIVLYLILIAEAVILASAVLLFHFCISHRRKMKVIRRTLKTYLEKKLEELVEVVDIDDEQKDLETLKSKSQSQTRNPTSAESELQTGT